MGGDAHAFPDTLWSVVLAARDRGAAGESLEMLVFHYWKPVYWMFRRVWGRSNEDAKDLTQEFFASFLEKDRLRGVEPSKGRFRTYLKVVLLNFLRNRDEAARAQKRGGRASKLSLGAGEPDALGAIAPGLTPEEELDALWAENLFRRARELLAQRYEAQGKKGFCELFEKHDLAADPPTCKELAREAGVSVHEVERRLKVARADFAKILRAFVRDTVSTDSDLESELAYLREALARGRRR